MPVAQLDRASDSDSEGRTFKSCRARHKRSAPPLGGADLLLHALRARFERSAHRRQSRLLGAASYVLAIRSSAVSCRARHKKSTPPNGGVDFFCTHRVQDLNVVHIGGKAACSALLPCPKDPKQRRIVSGTPETIDLANRRGRLFMHASRAGSERSAHRRQSRGRFGSFGSRREVDPAADDTH